mgnify:CR=1
RKQSKQIKFQEEFRPKRLGPLEWELEI